jgi:hypothetical protein
MAHQQAGEWCNIIPMIDPYIRLVLGGTESWAVIGANIILPVLITLLLHQAM